MMSFENIIGRGMIAREFAEKIHIPNYTIFASGVSNSKENDSELFAREENLLKKVIQNESKGIIYFSTTSIYDSSLQNSKYVIHKIKMEQLIKDYCFKYYVFRLPQIIGKSGNPNNLCNFLYKSIKNSQKFYIQKNAKRNIMDVSDLVFFVDIIVKNFPNINMIESIGNINFYSIIDIVNVFEKILNKEGIFTLVDGGGTQNFPISFMKKVLDICDYNFSENYLNNIISKYYRFKKNEF